MRDDIQRYWDELAAVARAMPLATLAEAAEWLLACYERGGQVFILGNGGSAATASHFACDLAKGTRTAGLPAFRVLSLTDNVPLLTAWANDTSYERVFAEQLAAFVGPGDLVVAISGSGNSPNVLAVVEVVRARGARLLALTGESGGQLAALADLAIRVPAGPIEQVEDAHLAVAHSLCVAIRRRLRARAVATALASADA
jgi:D-sedoheptulose 7-phosphate isomerase